MEENRTSFGDKYRNYISHNCEMGKYNCKGCKSLGGHSSKRQKSENSDTDGNWDKTGNEEDDDDNNNTDINNNSNVEEVNTELLPCLVCETSYKRKQDLMRHITKIHRLTNLCQICYFDKGQIRRFANPVSLRNHKVRGHPEDMVKCVCGAMLIDQKMLSTHLKKFKCNRNNQGAQDNEMIRCVCGKRFGSQSLVESHRAKCRKRNTKQEVGTSTKLRDNKIATDSNNNSDGAESFKTFGTRSQQKRKCKTKVQSYDEKHLDKALGFQSCEGGEGSVGHRRTRVTLSRYHGADGTDIPLGDSGQLHVQKGTVCTSGSNTATGCAKFVQRDANNNQLTEELPDEQSATEDMNYNIPTVTEGPVLHNDDYNDDDTGARAKCDRVAGSGRVQTKVNASTVETKKPKTDGGKTRAKRESRKEKPDDGGRYPCKTCRRRYKRPYLYVHQKFAHAKKQWVWMPSSRAQNKAGKQ